MMPVTWVPNVPGPELQLLTFRRDGRHRVQVKAIGTAFVSRVDADAGKSKLNADQRLRRVMQQVAATAGTRKTSSTSGPTTAHADGGGVQRKQQLLAPAVVAGALPELATPRRSALLRPAIVSAGVAAGTAAVPDASPTRAAGGADQGSFKVPPRRAMGAPANRLILKRRTESGDAPPATPQGKLPMAAPPCGNRTSSPASSQDSFHSMSHSHESSFRSAASQRAPSIAGSTPGSVVGRSQSRRIGGTGGLRAPTSSASNGRKTFSFFHTE